MATGIPIGKNGERNSLGMRPEFITEKKMLTSTFQGQGERKSEILRAALL